MKKSLFSKRTILLVSLSLIAGNLILIPNHRTDIAKSANDLYEWQQFNPYSGGNATTFSAKGSTFPKTGPIAYGNSLYIPDNNGGNVIIWKYNFDEFDNGNLGWSQLNTLNLSGDAFVQDMAIYQNSVNANELWISTHENCTLNPPFYHPASGTTCRYVWKNDLSGTTISTNASTNFYYPGPPTSPTNYFPYESGMIPSLKFKQFTSNAGVKKLYLTTERTSDVRMGTTLLRTHVFGNKNGNAGYNVNDWYAAFSNTNDSTAGAGYGDATTANYSQGKYLESFTTGGTNYLYLTASNPKTSPNVQNLTDTLYRSSDGTGWSAVSSTVDGNTIANGYFEKVIAYNNALYGQLIVTDGNGNKQSESIVKLNTINGGVHQWVTLKNFLSNGNQAIGAWVVYANKLYVSTVNSSSGTQVWNFDGANWKLVGDKGLYSTDAGETSIPNNSEVLGFYEYSSSLYALIKNSNGMQLRRMINPNCRWPSDIIYLLDRSFSMGQTFKTDPTHTKIDSAKEAMKLNDNAINIANEGSRVAVITFNGDRSVANVTGGFTSDMSSANTAINNITADNDSTRTDWHASSYALNTAYSLYLTSLALGHRPMIFYISDSVPTVDQNGNHQDHTNVAKINLVEIGQNKYLSPDTVATAPNGGIVLHDMMTTVDNITSDQKLYGAKILPIPIDLPYGGSFDYSLEPSYYMANNINPNTAKAETLASHSYADITTNLKNYYGKYSCSNAQGTMTITLPPTNVIYPTYLYLTQAGGIQYKYLITPQTNNWVFTLLEGIQSSPFTITPAYVGNGYGGHVKLTIRGFLPSLNFENLDYRISFGNINKKSVYDGANNSLYQYLITDPNHESAFFSDISCNKSAGGRPAGYICLRTSIDFSVPGLNQSLHKTLSETIKVPTPSSVGGNVYGQGSVSNFVADQDALIIGGSINNVNGGTHLPSYTLNNTIDWNAYLTTAQAVAATKQPPDLVNGTDPYYDLYLNSDSSINTMGLPNSNSQPIEGKLWYFDSSQIFASGSQDLHVRGWGTILVKGDIEINSNIICDQVGSAQPTRVAFIALKSSILSTDGNIHFGSNVNHIGCGAYVATGLSVPPNLSDGITFSTNSTANYIGLFISRANINLPHSEFHFNYDTLPATWPTVLLQPLLQKVFNTPG